MTRREQDQALAVALRAAKLGGQIALKYFRRLKNITLKKGAGLVSEADKESEAVIKKAIHKVFPTHRFLGEEGGYSEAPSQSLDQALWVVDPLDGTTNYVHGFPFFCVSIGLEVEKKTEVAVVHAPLMRYTFTALRGRGASMNGKKIHVSRTKKLDESLLATGFSYKKSHILEAELANFRQMAEQSRGIRRAGSAALDMCMVAWGVFDGFWERELAPWDTAAGALLVTEAGGKVTSFQGEPFHFSMNTVAAGNSHIHPQLIKTISH